MPDDRPNVLFLMSDQHSFRHVGFSGRETPAATPAIDGLAESGTVLDATYCPVPLCTPSRMCTLTGREAQRCGAWENWLRLDPELPTLPGVFSAAGYDTCLVGKMHLGGDRQFVGFEDRPYGDLTGGVGHQTEPPMSYWEREWEGNPKGWQGNPGHPAPHVTGIPESLLQERTVYEESVAWLREQGEDPWFLCASFSRPHGPLTAPERHLDGHDDVSMPAVWPDSLDHPAAPGEGNDREAMLTERGAYMACVEFLDEVIGDLLATLDREGYLENTVVVYTSDHGDMAGEHGLWWKQSWQEGSSHVPMAIRTPEHRAGERDPADIETPTSLLDLYPTLCSLAGVEYPDDLDGADLSAAVETGTEPDRGPVVCDTTAGLAEGLAFRMVRDGDYKYVRFRDAPPLLFDVASDPKETENLARGDLPAAGEELAAYAEETLDFDAVEAGVERAREERDDHTLPIPPGTGNAYLMPDGRLVDAATPLYQPDELAWEPADVFEDYPGDDN